LTRAGCESLRAWYVSDRSAITVAVAYAALFQSQTGIFVSGE
jgi:hypothetical protein